MSRQPISTCSQDSEASRSPRKPPGSKRSRCAKKSPDASGSSEKPGGSRSTPTSQNSTGDDTGAFPFLLGDHPASQPAEPGNRAARKMTAGSGTKLFAFLPNHGRIALFSRTLLGSSIWRSTEYLLRWQVMGVPRVISETYLLAQDEPSCALDSPQLRERLWIVGFMADTESRGLGEHGSASGETGHPDERGESNMGGADSDGPDAKHARDRRRQTSARSQPGQELDRPDSDGDVADTAGPSGTEQGRKSRRTSRRHSPEDHAPESGRTDKGLADAPEQHGRGREHAAPFSRWGDTLLADSERERRERGSERPDDPEDERNWSETFDAITRLHWDSYQWTSCSDGKFRRTPDEPFDVVTGLHRSVLAALGNAILPQAAFPILHAIRPHVR